MTDGAGHIRNRSVLVICVTVYLSVCHLRVCVCIPLSVCLCKFDCVSGSVHVYV